MGSRFKVVYVCAWSLIVAGTAPAAAQSSAWGDVTVSAVRLDYDLSGVGSAAGLAVRASRTLSPAVSVEFGGLYAKPDQQFGPSTVFIPEAQLRYNWHAGRLSPFVGGGVGAALVTSSFHRDWDPTLSVAGGTGVRLTERLGLTGEFRLRGHEWNATGTTTELSIGIAWLIPAF
jgi:hypothetical protein